MSKELLVQEFMAVPTQIGIPFSEHPWFRGLIDGTLNEEQILRGELQHNLRGWFLEGINTGILDKAIAEGDEETIAIAQHNYDEEVGGEKPHGDLMFQFHEEQGMTREEVQATELMPGTLACMAMLAEGVRRFSAVGSIAMMTLPEWQNAAVSAQVHPALQANTSFSDYAIETYRVHAIADIEHGDTQLDFLARTVDADPSLKPDVIRCLIYGAYAFNHNWDGQYQAAIDDPFFQWKGVQNDGTTSTPAL